MDAHEMSMQSAVMKYFADFHKLYLERQSVQQWFVTLCLLFFLPVIFDE